MGKPDFLNSWHLIQFKTAADQHLAISPRDGKAVGFSRTKDFDDYYKWLIVPASPSKNRYWIFNKGAQGQTAELLTLPVSMTDFGQWKFTGEPRQTFELRDWGNEYYTMICNFNRQALSTRWNAPAFTWDQNDTDDAQRVRFVPCEPINQAFTLLKGDGDPGSLDLEMLKVESDVKKPIDNTPAHVIGTALVAFPFVDEGSLGWSRKEQIKRSPYYLLQRECYWKLQDWYVWTGVEEDTREFTLEYGLTHSSGRTFERTVNIEIGANAKYTWGATAKAGSISTSTGGEIGFTFAASMGHKWQESSSLTREERTTEKVTRTRPKGGRYVKALWRLVNVYKLIRADQQVICEASYIEQTPTIERAWDPVTGSS